MFGSTNLSGSTTTHTNSFGSAIQPSQLEFERSIFGASSQPAFGSTGTPTFGVTSTPTFGATSTHAFGVTIASAFDATNAPAFGATSTPAFGSTSTPASGSTGNTFGVSNAPFSGEGAFGGSSNLMFDSSSASAFGTSSSPFGASSSPAFGASSTLAFIFGSTQAFGQSSTAFGSSSPFGSTTSAFGVSQTPTLAFGDTGIGQSEFGGQLGGSGVASYSSTTATDGGTFGQNAKLESILAMSVYKYKSHEELRWEDYQLGNKGSQSPASMFGNTSIGKSGFGGQLEGSRVASYLATTATDGGTFGQTAKLESISAMSVYKYKSHEELRCEDYLLGDKGSQSPTSVFGNTGIRHSRFGGHPRGSRVASYSETTPADSRTFGRTAKLESISAMPVYKYKSHEELRWEDYQLGDKGSQSSTSMFGNTGIRQSRFGSQLRGSRVTTPIDSRTFGRTTKLESISAMPVYKNKSHEELRWEDYQLGDKGGPFPSAQSTGLSRFGSSTIATNALSPSTSRLGQSSVNHFSRISITIYILVILSLGVSLQFIFAFLFYVYF